MKKISIILNILLILFIIFLFIKGNLWEPSKKYIFSMFGVEEEYNYTMNNLYDVRKEQFMTYEGQANIVMLGDSMTEFAHWNELLGRNDVVNRGISGDITEGILNRLETVVKVKPRYCFFMGGINDFVKGISFDITVGNSIAIINRLNDNGIRPVIQSVIYTGYNYDGQKEINLLASRINEVMKKFAINNNIYFLDLNNYLSEGGLLNPDYTYDGLHLNAKGYSIWGQVINEFLISQEEK